MLINTVLLLKGSRAPSPGSLNNAPAELDVIEKCDCALTTSHVTQNAGEKVKSE